MGVQNQLVQKPHTTFSTFITGEAVKNKINSIVGGKDGQRFITAILSAVSTNPTLSECDHGSILSGALLGESLKLSPSPQLGQYYLVPFNNRKKNCKEAQFQLGYKGYIQLAIRSGQYKKINVLAIKEGELIHYDPLNEEIEVKLIEDELERENTPTIGYYAMFEYLNGFRKTLYWSIAKMEAHADMYSQAFHLGAYKKLKAGEIPQADLWKYSSYWYKDFDGMAYKTMLRQLISKWGIMSIELQNALEKDMAVIDETGKIEYVENMTVECEEKPVEQEQKYEQKVINAQEEFFS
jgi:recombination protein RecT